MKTGKDSVKRTFAKDRRFKKAARTSDYLRTHWCVWWLAVGILQRRSEGNWSGVHPDILLPLAPPKKKLKENDGIHNPLVITHDHRFPNAHKPSTQHRLVAPCNLNTFELHSKRQTVSVFFTHEPRQGLSYGSLLLHLLPKRRATLLPGLDACLACSSTCHQQSVNQLDDRHPLTFDNCALAFRLSVSVPVR